MHWVRNQTCISLYIFLTQVCGINALEIGLTRNLNDVYRVETINERTVRFWFSDSALQKQPRLVNWSLRLLLHDNERLIAQNNSSLLQTLQIAVLLHLPYSPDVADTDHHYLRDLVNYLQGKQYHSMVDVFQDFGDSSFPLYG